MIRRVRRLLAISAAEIAHPMATAWRGVQRNIVRLAQRRGAGADGVQLARALAMAPYRSPEGFAARFRDEPHQSADGFRFPVEDCVFARRWRIAVPAGNDGLSGPQIRDFREGVTALRHLRRAL